MLTAQRQRGAATVEFYLVALLALLPMCLGILQTALLHVANHHVDNAAFMAARQGAVRNGDLGAMRSEFARVLTPLLAKAEPVDRDNVTSMVLSAYADALRDVTQFGRLEVISPDGRARQDFAMNRNGRRIIPNDSLAFRSAALGERSGISLQEANVLRVKFTYCRPVIVPFIRQMMLGFLQRIDPDPWHARCYADGRVPLVSIGTAPMQSDFLAGG
jgi:hypothetical protein